MNNSTFTKSLILLASAIGTLFSFASQASPSAESLGSLYDFRSDSVLSNLISSLVIKSQSGSLDLSQEAMIVNAIAPIIKRERKQDRSIGSNELFLRNIIGTVSYSALESFGFESMKADDEETQILGMDILGRLLCSPKALNSFRVFLTNELSKIDSTDEPVIASPLKLFTAAESLYFNGIYDGKIVLESALESEECPLSIQKRALDVFLSENQLPSITSLHQLLTGDNQDLQVYVWRSLVQVPTSELEKLNSLALSCFAKTCKKLLATEENSDNQEKLFDALVSYLERIEHDDYLTEKQLQYLHALVCHLFSKGNASMRSRAAFLFSQLAKESDYVEILKMIDDPDDTICAYGVLGLSRLAPTSIKENAGKLLSLLDRHDNRVKCFALFCLRRGLNLPASTFVNDEDFDALKSDIIKRYGHLE